MRLLLLLCATALLLAVAAAQFDETFDFIVVGVGTAGSIMASRLSETGRHSVLALEKGRICVILFVCMRECRSLQRVSFLCWRRSDWRVRFKFVQHAATRLEGSCFATCALEHSWWLLAD